MYRNTGKQIEIWASHEDNGGYKGIIEGNKDKKEPGIYTRLPVICKQRDLSMVNANVNSWRNNCKMDLKHIKETVEDAKRKIIDVMPENLPKRKRMLAPFLNLNPKKISLHAKHNTDDQQDFVIESNMEKKTTQNRRRGRKL